MSGLNANRTDRMPHAIDPSDIFLNDAMFPLDDEMDIGGSAAITPQMDTVAEADNKDQTDLFSSSSTISALAGTSVPAAVTINMLPRPGYAPGRVARSYTEGITFMQPIPHQQQQTYLQHPQQFVSPVERLDEDPGAEELAKHAILLDKRRRRRESHNAVERRRRDTINERINELATLIPPSLITVPSQQGSISSAPSSPSGTSSSLNPSSARLNKGDVLKFAIDYIKYLQHANMDADRRIRELEAALQQKNNSGGV